MASVYFHIPFCSKACHYCNFHFSTSLHRKSDLIAQMVKEVLAFGQQTGAAYQRPISSIYFGGGTPSLLSPEEMQGLLIAASQTFDLQADAEITLEANPDDISAEAAACWKSLGINRLSIGVQSFFDEDLRWMNRSHLAHQAKAGIAIAQAAGITNISIDLIYGLPNGSDAAWLQNLETAFDLGITHLSCYALTVEDNTALSHFISKGKTKAPNETQQAAQFAILQNQVEQRGWEAYEISNYAKPGFRSRHNSHYWSGNAYYGFGPSAHSFDGQHRRWWNVANNAIYQTGMQQGLPLAEEEILTPTQRINELIMTKLRTAEGVEVDAKSQHIAGLPIGSIAWAAFEKQYQMMIATNQLRLNNGKLKLTEAGKFFADGIAATLFLESNC